MPQMRSGVFVRASCGAAQPESAPAAARPRGIVATLTRNVRQDQACSACFAALTRALYGTRLGQDEIICIGQGWQGKTPEGLGIGRCCKGARDYVPGCPPTADAIAEKLAEYCKR